MPVVWTGAASRFLTGTASDGPEGYAFLRRCRLVAGQIQNSLQLGQIWYGKKRVRVAPNVEISATVISNFPGIEPLVRLQILIDGEPVEVEEQEFEYECTSAFKLSWPTWHYEEPYSLNPILIVPSRYEVEEGMDEDDIRFDTYVYNYNADPNEVADNDVIAAAKGSYKRLFRNRESFGDVDWQGRGPHYILTWRVGMEFRIIMDGVATPQYLSRNDSIAAYRGYSLPGDNQIYHCGRVKAAFGPEFAVLGAAIEERADELFLNAILVSSSGSSNILTFVTRPFGITGGDEEFETVSTSVIPWNAIPIQPFFFNASGSVASGLARRLILWNEPQSSEVGAWRRGYQAWQVVPVTMAVVEATLDSSGGTSFDTTRVDDYCMQPDEEEPEIMVLTKPEGLNASHPNFPNSMEPSDTFPIAVDWKGDTKTRCNMTYLREASTIEHLWVETESQQASSGTYSGLAHDILVSFENSNLPSFYAFELLENVGQYERTNQVPLTGSASHRSVSIQRWMPYIDLRHDFLAVVEVETTNDMIKPTRSTVERQRVVQPRWIFQQGGEVIHTADEPEWEQTLWIEQSPVSFQSESMFMAPQYLPNNWFASLAFFGTMPNYTAVSIFVDGGTVEHNSSWINQGMFRFMSYNIRGAYPAGVPYFDRKVNVATFDGDITAYSIVSAWREHNQIVDNSFAAVPTGQTLTLARIRTPFLSEPLNDYLGLEDDVGLRYVWLGNFWLVDDIFTITLV